MMSRRSYCLSCVCLVLMITSCSSPPAETPGDAEALKIEAQPQAPGVNNSPEVAAQTPPPAIEPAPTPKSAISTVKNATPVSKAKPMVISPKLSAQAREMAFSAMEQSLLSARPLHIEYVVVASGAMTADVSGHIWLTPEGLLDMTATGKFGGRQIKAHLRSNGAAFRLKLNDQAKTQQAPNALNPAVAIGLSRMGLLHNIAMASAGKAPDHSTGGVAEWVTVGNFRATPESKQSVGSHRFDIEVDGQGVGFADLVVKNGLPKSRYQEVTFPGGVMKVTETYRVVEVDRPAPAEAFTIE